MTRSCRSISRCAQISSATCGLKTGARCTISSGRPESDPGYDVTELLEEQSYDARGIVRDGERFYTSLGLPALPDSFWERSLLTRPADRDVVCHASAWNIDSRDDIRIKMCIHVNGDDFGVVHHELGHVYYSRAYQEQSPLFRSGAHDGFHEAIGDFIALNVTPEYLVQIGLLPPDQAAERAERLVAAHARGARQDCVSAVRVHDGSVALGRVLRRGHAGNLQRRLVGARAAQSGRQAAERRPADAFDPGAKFHIANNVPYLRYFLAYILQFQFYEAACKAAGWEGPLHRCSLYGNEEVGRHFNAMLAMGASQAVAGRPRGFYRLPRDERLGARRVLRAAHDLAQAAERRPGASVRHGHR